MEILLDSPERQQAFGQRLAGVLAPPAVLYLEGDLGSGKTTLTRGLLRGLGHQGSVRSPTYTLMEPYSLGAISVYHLDLYRLGDPEELEYLGLRDLLVQDAVWVVEWPARGEGFLPKPDLLVQILYAGVARRLILTPSTARGSLMLTRLREDPS